jgi:heme exporter protein C
MISKKPRFLTFLDIIAGVCMAIAVGMVFLYAPLEAVMGPVQRVFYFHVASAWTGMLSFFAAAAAGIGYLRTKYKTWDIISAAAVEIGMVFLLAAIVSGSIWARPIWNTWWTWDPRLTTVTIMELIYVAYLLLRQGIEEAERRARFGAVYAIVGFISVPMTFFSIRFYRTIHPVLIGSGDPSAVGTFDMSPRMLHTFLFSLAAFSVLFADLLWHRIRLGLMADHVARYHQPRDD